MGRRVVLAAILATVFVGCGKDDTTKPPPTGSCCVPTGSCAVTTLSACTGAWNPSDACDPDPCSALPWTDPITPQKVLINVQVAFSAKSVANYERSLSSDFTFLPAAADRDLVTASDPTFFDGWNKQREIATFLSVFQQSDGAVTFTWGPPIPGIESMLTDSEDPGGGRYFHNLKYRMVFQRVGADTTISGLVDLYLRDEAAGWSIYKWIDQQDGLGNATLGLVRWRQKVVY